MTDLFPVLIVAVLAPVVMSLLTGRQRHKEREQEAALARAAKLEDWARQDAVAKRAQEVATLLLASNERVALGTVEQNQTLGVILEVGKATHDLANSAYTAALQSELNATEQMRVTLMESIELRRALGQEPTPEALGVVETAIARVADLKRQIAERLVLSLDSLKSRPTPGP